MLVDSHCHLGHIDGGTRDVLEAAQAADVDGVIDVGMGVQGSEEAVARAASHRGVFAAVGLHPNDLEAFDADPDGQMAEIARLASSPSVVAVGETGIDLYRDRWPLDVQERAFVEHIALAKRVGKALVIHCRDAHDDVVRVLDREGSPETVVMHCFSGGPEHARACAERGWLCSFAGNVTFAKAEDLRDAARIVPPELLLAETDAPYLAPHPYRGRPNSPALLPHTVDVLADVRGMSRPELDGLVVANAVAAFGLAL